ncbi:hypothetical protein RSAG8_01315, partial [Rhizoctonia solani AG-8 WAC10335]
MNDDLDLQSILGEPRNSPKLKALIQKLGSLANPPVASLTPDSKSYAGTTYDNYYEIGISLVFTHPTKGSNVDEYTCDSIDVMNVPDAEAGNTRAAKTSSRYRPFPGLPLPLSKRTSTAATAPNLSYTLGNLDEKVAERGRQDLASGATGQLKASWWNLAGTRRVARVRGKREQKQYGVY